MLTAAARGTALFLGAFSLLNLAGDLRFARANANLWWIDFSPLPAVLRVVLLAAVALAMLAYGFAPRASRLRRNLTVALLVLATLAAFANAVRYYAVLTRGGIATSIPLPLSLVVACALIVILFAQRRAPERRPLFVAAAFVAASV